MFHHKALQINTFTKSRENRVKGFFLKRSYKKKNMTQLVIKSCENIILTEGQLMTYVASVNKILRKYFPNKNKFKLFLKVFPHISLTAKPREVRMGGGKGRILNWGCNLKAGQPLFVISYFNPDFELKEMEKLIFDILNQKTSVKIKLCRI